jgi:sugar phosphate isomerase/epimerase
VSDPRGHLHGVVHASAEPLIPHQWRSNREYLYGIDLFNHGYYWEAHEAWEAVWQVVGRSGVEATWLKGLIKLAAAGVKAREGNPRGVARHARRAAELFGEVAVSLTGSVTKAEDTPGTASFCGLSVESLCAMARELEARSAGFEARDTQRMLGLQLVVECRG